MKRKLIASIVIGIVILTGIQAYAAVIGHEEQAFLGLINDYRLQHGLQPLQFNEQLVNAADAHSKDMAAQNYFSHKSLNGASFVDRIKAAGYNTNTYLGENIAAGMWRASDVFKAWKNSPAHNQVMLGSQFRTFGIKRAFNPDSTYKWYWTADFGGNQNGLSAASLTAEQKHWAYSYMQWLDDNKGLAGYKDGSYRLDNPITRGEFAVMLAKAMDLKPVKKNLFKDTNNHWCSFYVTALVQNKVISGYVDGKFRPNELLTRAEMAQLTAKAGHLRLVSGETGFKDIEGHWAMPNILAAASNDLINGYPNGKFRPDALCLRADTAATIYRLTNK